MEKIQCDSIVGLIKFRIEEPDGPYIYSYEPSEIFSAIMSSNLVRNLLIVEMDYVRGLKKL